jgi:hypothetical protein
MKEHQILTGKMEQFKTMGAMNAQIVALQKSGDWNNIPLQLRIGMEYAAKSGNEGEFKVALDNWTKGMTAQREITEKPYSDLGKIAMDKYGKNFKDLTSKQQNDVRAELAKIEKTKETPPKPSDFDKKWSKAEDIAKGRKKGGKPTTEEIADAYRQKFGSADLLSTLLGTSTQNPLGLEIKK